MFRMQVVDRMMKVSCHWYFFSKCYSLRGNGSETVGQNYSVFDLLFVVFRNKQTLF